MSRHHSTETFQMDIRSSPSQQNLDPLNSRSSSLRSQAEEDNEIGQESGPPMMNPRKHKLDLYSIPVFLLEVLLLAGLTYVAYYIHFQYNNDSYLEGGFYCDDTSLRQHYKDNDPFVQWFNQKQNELTFVIMLLVVTVVLIIFCELVNSMFGALKFRQIRALCKCCKLHSITRRSIRFSGAFILGFLICMISCDILATTSGRLRPYFAQECPSVYQRCSTQTGNKPATSIGDFNSLPTSFTASQQPSTPASLVPASVNMDITLQQQPSSKPISASSPPINESAITVAPTNSRAKRALDVAAGSMQPVLSTYLERRWIDLAGEDLRETCQFSRRHANTEEEVYKFQQLVKSWPSFPATLLNFSCLYLAFYLCFVGTARPFRMLSSLIVVVLLLSATIFNVHLVKLHYNHWSDVAAAAILALVTVLFVLLVYLNRFKDTHYYENQKIYQSKGRQLVAQDSFKNYSGETGIRGNYKANQTPSTVNLTNGAILQNGVETNGSVSNNDLAMRYFQIPRANYRGAPRPISSLQQMRS